MEVKKITQILKEKFPGKLVDSFIQFNDEIIVIGKDDLYDVVKFLIEEPYSFTMLLDLTCVDYKGEAERFEMVYHLFSLKTNQRIRLKIRLSDKDPEIKTLTVFWKNANWLEREVYDMFGVEFTGHPDLRRLFMYDGFEGYPLRKDYPLRKQQPIIPMRKKDDD
jgi:NADH-quinone oxidoreductase subunit C